MTRLPNDKRLAMKELTQTAGLVWIDTLEPPTIQLPMADKRAARQTLMRKAGLMNLGTLELLQIGTQLVARLKVQNTDMPRIDMPEERTAWVLKRNRQLRWKIDMQEIPRNGVQQMQKVDMRQVRRTEAWKAILESAFKFCR